MSKRAIEISWTAITLLALACGGKAEEQGSAGVSGAAAVSGAAGNAGIGSSAGGSPSGIGPIDTTSLPSELPMDCVGPTSPPRLALPCKLGSSLGGGNVLECYDLGGGTALTGLIPFAQLQTRLDQPIPFAPFEGSNYGKVTVDGVQYRGVLQGNVIFSQIDPPARAFVATLTAARITWTGINDAKLTFTCAIPDSPFWAVKGDFL